MQNSTFLPIIRQKQREWLLLLGAIFAAGLVLGWAYVSERERKSALESERLQILSNVIANNIETNLKATSLALEGVAHDFYSEPQSTGRSNDISRRLRALEVAMPGIGGIAILNGDGVVTHATRAAIVGRDLSFREYFKRARAHPVAGMLYVSEPFHSLNKNGELVIAVARMIPTADGRFNGLLVATLDRGYFSSVFSSVLYAPDVWAFVIHGDGRQLLNFPRRDDSDGIDLNRADTLYTRFRRSGRPAGVVTGELITNHELRMMAFHMVQPAELNMDKPLVIGLNRSVEAIAAPVRAKGLSTLAAYVLLSVLACTGLYWIQSRRAYIQALGADLERKRIEADERNQLNFALRESEVRFRTLIEDAPLAIAILRRGVFEYTNPRYRALHGYGSDDDLKGVAWSAVLAPESRLALQEQQALIAVDSPIEQMFEAVGLGKDGALVPVFKTTTRVELADGPATVIFAQDISAQKRAESALRQARDAAEAANRSKAEFLANMSHEIRSPLNAMLGLAYLLEQARLEPDARSMVHKIRASGRTLLGIINDVLDVSKIEAGHMVLEHAPFRLSDVIDNVAGAMGLAAGEKEIDLIIQPPPQGVVYVVGDALRLEQVLINLTSNAVKFTEAGRVELRVELVARCEQDITLKFCVEDTGIGIAQEHQGDVFSAFMQADSSTTRRFGGTGLGLAICRQLVALMGGEIGLSSVLGEGSQFWFTLPLQQISNRDFSSAGMVSVAALIADDSAIALQAVGAIAQGLGWQVKAVDSGESAVAHVRAQKDGKLPNVVILDWKMPGMDGLAAARAIRESVPVDSWPVVIMATAFSMSELSSCPGVEMVDAILTKPITSSSLYNAVLEAQHRRAATVGIPSALRQHVGDGLAGIRVLLVDDSEINREVARLILTEQGAEVMLAVDGKDALDWLLAHPDEVDLVLMDVQMPVMDGIEATRRLRQLPQFADLPVVALTAGAFKSQQDAARAAGMVEFISKPFDVPSTIALIQRLHRRAPGKRTRAPRTKANTDNIQFPGNPELAPQSPEEAAKIDVVRGLQIWSDVQVYRDYLRRFVDGYETAADTMAASLDDGDHAGAAALAHKLTGVAANLALPGTQQTAGEVERSLATGHDASAALAALRTQLALVVEAIARFAPAPQAGGGDDGIDRSDAAQQARTQLLAELMDALDSDSPGPVEPILSRLATWLPQRDLVAVWDCVKGFDFRGAEATVARIAAEYGIAIKE